LLIGLFTRPLLSEANNQGHESKPRINLFEIGALLWLSLQTILDPFVVVVVGLLKVVEMPTNIPPPGNENLFFLWKCHI
jgi:hypothetical protein